MHVGVGVPHAPMLGSVRFVLGLRRLWENPRAGSSASDFSNEPVGMPLQLRRRPPKRSSSADCELTLNVRMDWTCRDWSAEGSR